MLKRRKKSFLYLLEQGCALLIGIALLLAMQSGSWLGQWINWSQSDEQRFNSPKSAVTPTGVTLPRHSGQYNCRQLPSYQNPKTVFAPVIC